MSGDGGDLTDPELDEAANMTAIVSALAKQVWSLSGLKVSWQVLRKLESSLVRFLAHDFLAETTEEPGFSQVKKSKFCLNLL